MVEWAPHPIQNMSDPTLGGMEVCSNCLAIPCSSSVAKTTNELFHKATETLDHYVKRLVNDTSQGEASILSLVGTAIIIGAPGACG